ncbi:MAG TPA: FG-GAP-like repeat-containing protein [Flavisolibacter sp.]|nr:FG-GAP-like repeat-containing protein [Flavisolibacter sp.]
MRKTLLALVLVSALYASAQTSLSPNTIYYQENFSPGSFRVSNSNKTYHVDANGDGRKDIVALNGYEIFVYTANGNGGFAVTPVFDGGYSFYGHGTMAAADLNKDGKLDFVWYNEFFNDLIVRYWSGTGSDNLPEYTAPTQLNLTGLGAVDDYWAYQMGLYGINTADIDGDGDVDILGFGPNGIQRPHMIINNGDGSFTRYDLHSEAAYQSFSQVTDWNGDGRLDVLVPENGGIVLYTNDGNSGVPSIPSFTKTVLVSAADASYFDSNGGYFDVVDFNQDGKKDILLNAFSYDFLANSFYTITRVLMNTTAAAPAYTFVPTELERTLGFFETMIGGFGARYEDVDGNGMLDVIGITGIAAANTSPLRVTLFSIDGQNVVTATQAPLISKGPLTAGFGEAGVNLAIEDIDGDNQRDYVIGHFNYPNVVSYRTRFPHFSQSGVTDFMLENKVFVGGNNADMVTLTVNITGGAGSFSVPNDNGAVITDNGSLTVTIEGTVEQINYCLASSFFTPANNAVYQLNFSVTNALSETFTNSLRLNQGGSILPVQGLTLAATKKAGAAIINWQTQSEQNALDFLVQHSSNGTNWTTIGTVTANGNSTIASHYSFVHQQPVTGVNFYRLIQRDNNGRFIHSSVVTLAWTAPASSLAVYPNPVVGKKLSVVLEEAVTVQVYDARGVMVLQQKMQKGLNELNLSGFASGMYLLQAGKAQQKLMVP